MNKVIECQIHNKYYENICKDCNVLLCRICVVQHLRENRDHSCYHIDEIKESLNILDNTIQNNLENYNNNNNNNTTENYLQEELIKIWNSIKSSSSDLSILELNESEISNHFKQFHEYLIIEEHKLKSKISNDIESIKKQTNHQINQLKSIINIINLNKNNNRNPDISQDEDEIEVLDKTSQYSIETIIKTIQESLTLNQFLKRNNKTIFDQQHNQQYQNNQDLLNNLNNDINLSILESIHNHKKLYNDTNIITQQHEYTITIDNQSIENAKQSINKSIELTANLKVKKQQIKSSIPSTTLSGIILSTNTEGKIATLFDTNNDNKVIGEIDFIHNTEGTFNSTINTGEYVYIFGGFDKDIENKGHDRYIRYSIKEKKIDHRAIIDAIDFGFALCACFDGSEYIYFVGGCNSMNNSVLQRIDRFSTKTMKFEKYFKYDKVKFNAINSFYYNGLIYIIPLGDKKIYVFNTSSKLLRFYPNEDLILNPQAACSDGKGNIYIISGNKQFIRFNIKSKKVDQLSPLEASNADPKGLESMVYVHGIDGKTSRIYVFGGKFFKNFIYSIENNQWSTSFYPEDSYNRLGCGSVLI